MEWFVSFNLVTKDSFWHKASYFKVICAFCFVKSVEPIFRAIIKWREKIRKDEAPEKERDEDVEMEEEEEDEEVRHRGLFCIMIHDSLSLYLSTVTPQNHNVDWSPLFGTFWSFHTIFLDFSDFALCFFIQGCRLFRMLFLTGFLSNFSLSLA